MYTRATPLSYTNQYTEHGKLVTAQTGDEDAWTAWATSLNNLRAWESIREMTLEDWQSYNWDTSDWPDWVNTVVCKTSKYTDYGSAFYYFAVEKQMEVM